MLALFSALAAMCFVPAPKAAVDRRQVLAAPLLTSMAAAVSASSTAPTTERAFTHSLTSVAVAGVSIPVAVWRPATTFAAPATYPYKIDIGKIAKKLRVGWLGWLPSFSFDLPCGAVTAASPPAGFARARDGDCLLFAHGFLGSIYDFAHAAEAMAADGFTVVAPELPESLSASFIPPDGLGREEIIAAARELIDSGADGSGSGGDGSGGAPKRRWGIFGHSAGAGSALNQRGDYSLGRAALAAGLRRGYDSRDPIFLCCSDGDGCNAFMARSGYDLRSAIADGGFTTFGSISEAYASPSRRPPSRASFIFSDENTPAPLPCHISFLWSEVDEAMASLLTPFLPLAKALGLFLLDFDVYLETRDAEKTAAQVVPALRRFFLSNSA